MKLVTIFTALLTAASTFAATADTEYELRFYSDDLCDSQQSYSKFIAYPSQKNKCIVFNDTFLATAQTLHLYLGEQTEPASHPVLYGYDNVNCKNTTENHNRFFLGYCWDYSSTTTRAFKFLG